MVNPTLAWERVGKRFYRTFEGYNMQWSVNVTESHLAVAPCGGAIAVWDKPDVLRAGTARRAQITIYSGAGRLITTMPWDLGVIAGASWTDTDELIVAARSGVVRKYTDFAGNFVQVNLPAAIVHLQWLFDGLVVQDEESWVLVTDFGAPTFRKLSIPPQLLDWVAVPADQSSGRDYGVFASVNDEVTLFTFDGQRQRLQIDPLFSLRMSPDYMWFMGQVEDSLVIYSMDVFAETHRFKFNGVAYWVGVSAVAALDEDDALVVVDLTSHSQITLEMEGPVSLHTEFDGLRIISDHSHEFFAPVPDVVSETFRLGSSAPSAILLNCIDLLDKNSPQANENLRVIGSSALPAAVTACCIAASYELDPRWQKRLLRAAAFGKAALDVYDSSFYLETLDKLRIANTLRAENIGMLVTVAQLDHLGPQGILRRLQALQCYAEAIATAQVLKWPVETVYIAWACHQIQSSVDLEDQELAQVLAAKLDNIMGISYVEIAQRAFDEGRPNLARTLIDREPQATRRVQLLLRLREPERALQVAVDSGNIDLLFYTVLSLATSSEVVLPQFYRLLGDKRPAIDAYKRLAALKPNSADTIHKFLYQMDLGIEDINLEFHEACEKTAAAKKLQLGSVQKRYSELKQTHFESQVVSEFVTLLNIQEQLESEYEMDFANLSVSDTISALLNISQTNRAQKVASKLHISDKQFWWLRIRSLVSRREWTELLELAKSRKSPIGYVPFYDLALNAGNIEAAGSFVDMCTNVDYRQRIDMYLRTNQRGRALELAEKLKDEALIRRVQESA